MDFIAYPPSQEKSRAVLIRDIYNDNVRSCLHSQNASLTTYFVKPMITWSCDNETLIRQVPISMDRNGRPSFSVKEHLNTGCYRKPCLTSSTDRLFSDRVAPKALQPCTVSIIAPLHPLTPRKKVVQWDASTRNSEAQSSSDKIDVADEDLVLKSYLALDRQLHMLEIKIQKAVRLELGTLNKLKACREKREKIAACIQASLEDDAPASSGMMVLANLSLLRASLERAILAEKVCIKRWKQIYNRRYQWTKTFERTIAQCQALKTGLTNCYDERRERLPPLLSSSIAF